MPRGDQVARLYTLVSDLARSRHGVPVATLARRHSWKLRTVYRDLDALEKAGFPVTKLDGGKWKLIDGWREELPFPLSSGELLALYVARDLMRPLGDAPPVRSFDRLLRKLALPRARRSAGQGELFPEQISPLSMPSELGLDYSLHRDTVEALWDAVTSGTTVDCEYYSAQRDAMTRRRLDPYELHFDPRLEALYLFAFCHERDAVRTFAVHRFRSVRATSDGFEKRKDFDVDRHLRGAFRIWRSENVERIVLRFPKRMRWVAERRWHASQKVAEERGGSFCMEMSVGAEGELRRFILGFGADVEVVAPIDLRNEIAAMHEAAATRDKRSLNPVGKHRLTLDDKPSAQARRKASGRA